VTSEGTGSVRFGPYNDAELQELLGAPGTPEEKDALDALVSDPEQVLARAQQIGGVMTITKWTGELALVRSKLDR
jgi:hypothetical protein